MVNQLQMIYNTLNLIEVKGHANTGYISSCMGAIQTLIEQLSMEQEPLDNEAGE